MKSNVLTDNQRQILPLIREFSNNFGLVGGTAIAFHLGHRRSIDFDLFSYNTFPILSIRNKINQFFKIEQTLSQGEGELTVIVNGVKLTLFHFPYKIDFNTSFEDVIKIPDLLTLASMKAFALGKRAKWKDYVDLFFITKKFSLKQIVEKTIQLFGNEFNEKLFRVQLSYFKDVDYSEKVEYMDGFEIPNEEIKKSLEKISLINI